MRIAFWGNFGTHNFGNECTLHAMLHAAGRHVPRAELVVIANGPADTSARHHVAALPIACLPPHPSAGFRPLAKLRRGVARLFDWVRAVRTMRACDMLVITGTGMLADKNEGLFGGPYQLFKWVVAARLCRTKVAFVSVGAEDVWNRLNLALLGSALHLARYRSYRDEASKKRASRLMRKPSRDPIYPDLAFSLAESLTASPPGPRPEKPGVAVGIYAVDGGPAAMRRYVETVGSFVLWLLERGYRTRIVIGDAAYDQVALAELRAWLQGRGALDRVVDEQASSFEELMQQLGQVDFVVGTRFHNLVLALLLAKPVVSLSHMDKNDELLMAMGLDSYRMPLDTVEPRQLQERFLDMEKNADELRRLIREKAARWRELLEEQYRLVFGERASSPVPEP